MTNADMLEIQISAKIGELIELQEKQAAQLAKLMQTLNDWKDLIQGEQV